MTRRSFLLSSACATQILPQTPLLQLRARSRARGVAVTETLKWDPAKTAIIICDMWDNHYCQSSARRVELIAPRMNVVVVKARMLGVHVIHAPSGTMDVYTELPQRKRMQTAKFAKPPVPIANWCYLDEKAEGPLPVDDQTEPCDDAVVGEKVRRYSRQNKAIQMEAPDGISDNGQEIYNYFEQERISNVALMGVHLNMCVLGRSFGIRQMTRLGKNVLLARDLIDSMYDPRQKPYVTHDKGTELLVEHVERHWCPSILGEDLTRLG